MPARSDRARCEFCTSTRQHVWRRRAHPRNACRRPRPPGPMHSSFALCFEGRLAGAVAARGASSTLLGPVRTSRPWQVRTRAARLSQLLETDASDLAVVHSAWSHMLLGPAVRRTGYPLVRWLHAAESRAIVAGARGRPGQARLRDLQQPLHVRGVVKALSGRRTRGVLRAGPFRRGRRPDTAISCENRSGTPAEAIVVVMAARMEA